MSLTDDLRACGQSLELDWLGCCPVDRFDEAPEDRKPRVYLQNARSIVSIGYRLNVAPLQNLPVSRSAYMLEHDYANRHLDRASHKVARFFEERGFDAIGFDPGAGFYHEAGKTPERFAGDFSHKHAAVACGLGVFGLNNLVISARWGPRIRLASIITSAELERERPRLESPCRDCRECVEACPVRALDGWDGAYDPKRGWVIDKQKCYEHIFTTLKGKRCGMCIKACPVGI